MNRRDLLLGGAGALALAGCKTRPATLDPVVVKVTPVASINPLDSFFEELEKRTFNYFWDTAEPETGLVPDRWPNSPFASIAACGFALNAYAIGAERGWVTRAQARARVLQMLKFLYSLPQGPDAYSTAGYQGFFYHFLNFRTGLRYGGCELSTVDTALFMAGVLFVSGYFNADHPEEAEIRKVADDLYGRVNWPWSIEHVPDIRMSWSPEQLFNIHDWRGYNEGMIVYVLALGSPTHPAAPGTWVSFTSNYYQHWGTLEGQTHLTFGPMFGHQFSAIWIDYRGIKDEFMWPQGIDYFENSRRATLAQRAYAIRNPMDWKGYGPNIWGLTACDGPADVRMPYLGQTRQFHSYAARGVSRVDTVDDGTIAPYAAIASLPFAPEIVMPAAREMYKKYGSHIYTKYGFVDSFNPSFDYDNVPLRHGKRVRGGGWVATDYLGIDQGPIIAMLENYRSELIWSVMRRNPYIRSGLQRAGFEGGWLDSTA
ncbi:MAG TPA: glucoamylase family protein [Steroidobacteraceae bacterium]|nr:glucoamylase family protein [Steroidobacteraceae bacterium]